MRASVKLLPGYDWHRYMGAAVLPIYLLNVQSGSRALHVASYVLHEYEGGVVGMIVLDVFRFCGCGVSYAAAVARLVAPGP
mmetsp:Transcript_52042/g.114213  ORF Transcript_52042/g.114213 Transcript_52042/m.114213 type:complete len:81 (+) Transcript_52042:2858-3100(+)